MDEPAALALSMDLGVEDFLAFFKARFEGVEAMEQRRAFSMGEEQEKGIKEVQKERKW